jgi:hypothetical protein
VIKNYFAEGMPGGEELGKKTERKFLYENRKLIIKDKEHFFRSYTR